ncbi:endonuclease [Haliovirga abyssi]|uniref:GH29D-like beta-sandwich domain-containing protein n=1 Tax=Haliovirga abyssi TaxID=2996794 RepID=A0AAU9DVJ2_9FUSO|nr:endonuclease [Haliovirga abyssi]BDU51384.1 hypothetical protein HLVA_19530 [Haliovirga abyssi]
MKNLKKRYNLLLSITFIIIMFLSVSCAKTSTLDISNRSNNKEAIIVLEKAQQNIEEYLVELDSGALGKHLTLNDREKLRGSLQNISTEYKKMIISGILDGEKIKEINAILNEEALEIPRDTKEQLFVKEMAKESITCYEKVTGEVWGSWDYSESFVEDGYTDRGWNLVAEAGTVNWQYDSHGAKMSAYKSGESSNIAWMISPELVIGELSVMNFESAQAYPKEGTELKVLISENYSGNVGTATWTELTIPHLATKADGKWSYVDSEDVSLSAYEGKKVHIGFKYIGSNTLSTAFEIKNLKIKNSSVVSGTVSKKVSDPIFTPAAGTYTTKQAITLSSDTDGATIYYTLDGTTPSSASTKYTGAFNITVTTTVKSIAIKDSVESAVITANYIIKTDSGSSDYYASIGADITGSALKAELNDIIDNQTELTYSEVYDALVVTDRDPNNANNVIEIYTGKSIDGPKEYDGGKGWNREHVWAKSHGDFGTTKGPGTDLHHIRVADVSVNSARGNKEFDIGGTPNSEATECKSDSDSWEPRDEVKGDIARMLFYMAVRYEGEHGEPDLKLSEDINDDPKAPTHGKLSVLLEWNKNDPVSETEIRRNNIIDKDYQHNRNPFIDHPEYANRIWGN